MKLTLIISGAVLLLSLIGLNGMNITKVSNSMTQADVLRKVSNLLENYSDLKLSRVSCKAIFGDESLESRHCYKSTIKPDTISILLAKALSALADTPGWTTDYAIPGAFYQMKADTRMTFGIAVKAIPDSIDLGKIEELKGYESYVVLTVNSQRKS